MTADALLPLSPIYRPLAKSLRRQSGGDPLEIKALDEILPLFHSKRCRPMSTVMIAEDDLLIADMLADALVAGGYEVCGIARTVEQGIELGDRCKPDFAVLDVRLADGGLGTDIAARLHSRGGVGILYASGNSSHVGLTKDDGEALLHKPYRPERRGPRPEDCRADRLHRRGIATLSARVLGTYSTLRLRSAHHQIQPIIRTTASDDSVGSRRSLRTNTLHGATLCPKPSATAPQPKLCRPSSSSILTIPPTTSRRMVFDVIDA